MAGHKGKEPQYLLPTMLALEPLILVLTHLPCDALDQVGHLLLSTCNKRFLPSQLVQVAVEGLFHLLLAALQFLLLGQQLLLAAGHFLQGLRRQLFQFFLVALRREPQNESLRVQVTVKIWKRCTGESERRNTFAHTTQELKENGGQYRVRGKGSNTE